MPNAKMIRNILDEIESIDKKLENGEVDVKTYLAWKSIYQNNLVDCYSNIIEDLKSK